MKISILPKTSTKFEKFFSLIMFIFPVTSSNVRMKKFSFSSEKVMLPSSLTNWFAFVLLISEVFVVRGSLADKNSNNSIPINETIKQSFKRVWGLRVVIVETESFNN